MRHLTAEDVYRQLLSEGLDIGLATVYRVLTQFEQAGLLTRHHFESGKSVFELNEGRHHDHLVCFSAGGSRSSTIRRSRSGRRRSRRSGDSRSPSTRSISTPSA